MKPPIYAIHANPKKFKENTISLNELIKKLPIDEQKAIEKEAEYLMVSYGITKARKSLKLTQQQLAEKSGIPRTTISKIESGYRNTTVSMLDKIAEAMNKKLVISFQ